MTEGADEHRLLDAIAARRDELVELASALVAFDTTAREPGDPPREEAALQAFLGERLRAVGAEVDIWEPPAGEVAASRQVPEGLDFTGRPQLVARLPGHGGGRSLLLNGHVDVVSGEPAGRWRSPPFAPEVRDGRLFGRGTCDMKGGVAAMVLAAEAIAASGLRLGGDLIVNTVTDEESSGAGGIAAVAHGVRADAGIVPEPTGFDVWVACRGTVTPTIVVPGRPGHAEVAQPHWRAGGAVNAIEKAALVLEGLRALREEWRGRPDHRHPHLSPGDVVPTVISGGEWSVTYPASCRITADVTYLPAQADPEGWGTRVEEEIAGWIERIAAVDPWLREHPPAIEWSVDVPPAEVAPDAPIVETMLGAGADAGRPGRRAGLDSWFDGATFTRFGGTPSVAFGPAGLNAGAVPVAHTIDEYVPVDDLVATAQALALAALRFCR